VELVQPAYQQAERAFPLPVLLVFRVPEQPVFRLKE